jgi:two-component system, cell cycle sensor histidine kinase and response regulator CckA
LEVSDTGCGIAPDAQPKIFDPFFTTKSMGHGLGLAVVQRIVQGLGGAVQLETEPGRGATFRILLPSAPETAPPVFPAGASPASEELNCAGIVLVVEDEAPLRLAVARLLRKNALFVMEAANGTAALSLLREHNDTIAVVLLDITLPGAPSHEVLAEARRLRPDIKVIVTSAYGPQKVDECFPGMEIDAFIRKPYLMTDLVTLVRRLSSPKPPPARKAAET